MDPNISPPTGKLNPLDRLQATIEDVAALGRGVTHADGFAILVNRGVPGERVELEITRVHPNYAQGRVTRVQTPATERVEPLCPHFAACGGCDWQHVAYPAQLRFKRRVLEAQLQRIGGLEAPSGWELVAAGTPFGYRDKLEFTPVWREGRWQPVFHALEGSVSEGCVSNSRVSKGPVSKCPVVPVEHCRLAPESFSRLARSALDVLASVLLSRPAGTPSGAPEGKAGETKAGKITAGETAAGKTTAFNTIAIKPTLNPVHRITVQGTETPEGSPALALLVSLNPPPHSSRARTGPAASAVLGNVRKALRALCAGEPSLAACGLLHPAVTKGKHRRAPKLEMIQGPPELVKRVNGRAYRVPIRGFFQVHPEMAGEMCRHVVERVAENFGTKSKGGTIGTGESGATPLYDLFSGSGLFSLPLAERGFAVVGVDTERAALDAARKSARREGRSGVHFRQENLDRAGVLPSLAERWGPPAAMIVDPPRRGLGKVLCRDILAARPPLLVYVSCDGGTFARDAARLAPDYGLESLRGFDLFPQTHHLEIVGVFRLRR